MSPSLSTSWTVSLTSGHGLVHSLCVPAASALLHAKSPHRNSYAFLNFKTVHSRPHIFFQITAATTSKLSVSGLCTADLLLSSVKSKKEHQVWKSVVTEFRYQKSEGANGSALELYITLLALQLPSRPWANHHRSSTSELKCRLGRRFLILSSTCFISTLLDVIQL